MNNGISVKIFNSFMIQNENWSRILSYVYILCWCCVQKKILLSKCIFVLMSTNYYELKIINNGKLFHGNEKTKTLTNSSEPNWTQINTQNYQKCYTPVNNRKFLDIHMSSSSINSHVDTNIFIISIYIRPLHYWTLSW